MIQFIEARAESILSPDRLALYRHHSREPDLRRDLETVAVFAKDHALLTKAGALKCALGAGIEVVDLGLRIAATPSPTERSRRRKADYLRLQFRPLVESISQGFVADIAEAAVCAEEDPSRRPDRPRVASTPRGRRATGARGRWEEATSGVPQARMRDYASAVDYVDDLESVVAALAKVRADRLILVAEDRAVEVIGADRAAAGVLRRVCSTAAASASAAVAKLQVLGAAKEDVLAADRPDRRSDALMSAMIGAAMDLEGLRWSVASTRH